MTSGNRSAAAASSGLAVMAAGTAPLAPAASAHPTADARYLHMSEEYRRIADEQLICGAQVHVDVPDRDTAVRAMCVVSPWLPVLLALSVSSPFWQGADTGYASWRYVVLTTGACLAAAAVGLLVGGGPWTGS